MPPELLSELKVIHDNRIDGELYWNGHWKLYSLKLIWSSGGKRKVQLKRLGLSDLLVDIEHDGSQFFRKVSEDFNMYSLKEKLRVRTHAESSDVNIEGPWVAEWFLEFIRLLRALRLIWIVSPWLKEVYEHEDPETERHYLTWITLKNLPFRSCGHNYKLGVYLRTVAVLNGGLDPKAVPAGIHYFEFWSFRQR